MMRPSPRRCEKKALKKNHSAKFHNLTLIPSMHGSNSSSKMGSPEKSQRKMHKMNSVSPLTSMP